MKKPIHPCDYATPGAPYVRRAFDGLAHFHVEHTSAGVTIWENDIGTFTPTGEPVTKRVLFCVASDPVLVRRIQELLKPFMRGVILDDGDTPPQPPPPKVVH